MKNNYFKILIKHESKSNKCESYISLEEFNGYCEPLKHMIDIITGKNVRENECIYFEKKGEMFRVRFDFPTIENLDKLINKEDEDISYTH